MNKLHGLLQFSRGHFAVDLAIRARNAAINVAVQTLEIADCVGIQIDPNGKATGTRRDGQIDKAILKKVPRLGERSPDGFLPAVRKALLLVPLPVNFRG